MIYQSPITILREAKSLLLLICLSFLFISNFGEAKNSEKKWTNNASGSLFGTPDAACDDFIKLEFPAKNYPSKIKDTAQPDIKGCYYLDTDDNNKEYYKTTVWQVDVTPGNDNTDCDRDPNGPYGELEGSDNIPVASGKDFDGKQVKKIQDAWKQDRDVNNNGILTSDDPNDPCNKYERLVGGKLVVGLVLPPKGPFTPGNYPFKDICEAQVDHIIPQKAPDGSNCGSNSYGNARVISRCVNGKRKNNPNFDSSGMTMEDCSPKPSNPQKLDQRKPPLGDQKQTKPPLGNPTRKP